MTSHVFCQIQTCSKFNIVVLSLSAYTLSLFDLPDALMMVDDGEENPLQALIYAREGVCNPILFTDMDSLNPADNNTTKSTGFCTNVHYFLFRRFQIFELNVFKS